MPWTEVDADKHHKGLSSGQAKRWARIANSILADCLRDNNMSLGECEVKAIRIANDQVNKAAEPRKGSKLKSSKDAD